MTETRPAEDIPYELWCDIDRDGSVLPHEWRALDEVTSECRYCRMVVEG